MGKGGHRDRDQKIEPRSKPVWQPQDGEHERPVVLHAGRSAFKWVVSVKGKTPKSGPPALETPIFFNSQRGRKDSSKACQWHKLHAGPRSRNLVGREGPRKGSDPRFWCLCDGKTCHAGETGPQRDELGLWDKFIFSAFSMNFFIDRSGVFIPSDVIFEY